MPYSQIIPPSPSPSPTESRRLFYTSVSLLLSHIQGYCYHLSKFHRTWKQPRSADEWIRKQWYICTMEYYSAIKKNTFESVLMMWMKLEPIIQSEVSQKEKHQYSILTHIYGRFFTIWATREARDITLPTKFHIVKAMVFPVVMYKCESWTIKKAEHWRIDSFEL